MTVSFQRGTKVHNPQVFYKTEQVLLQNLPLLERGGCAGLTSARQTFTVPFYILIFHPTQHPALALAGFYSSLQYE